MYIAKFWRGNFGELNYIIVNILPSKIQLKLLIWLLIDGAAEVLSIYEKQN